MKKLFAILLVAAMLLVSVSAMAEAWPTKPIELIVPANPGGDTDTNARSLATALEKVLGQPVAVVNMSGASGGLAFEDLMQTGADGYRFVFYHSGAAITQLLGMYDFDVLNDFQLAAMPIMDATNAFVTSKDAPYKNLQELAAYMTEHPGEVSFATETGSFTHVHAVAFEQAAGVEFQIADAGTAAQKTTALLAGEIDVIGTQYGLVKDYFETGDFVCLGIMSADKLDVCPDAPTFVEQGYDVVFNKFFYIAAHNDVPAEVIEALNAACKAVNEDAEYLERCANSLVSPNYFTAEETEAYYASQLEGYASYLADYID